jgi:hypothetical protein
MQLTEGEKTSLLWIKLYGFFEDRLKSNRLLLEGSANEKESDKLRGRIAEAKLCMSLHDEVSPTVPNVEV